MSHYAYIVECADGTLYVGYTTDVKRRLKAHNAGRGSRYTRGRRPVRLVYVEELSTESAARRRENTLRKLRRSQKLRLIGGEKLA